MFNTTCAYLQTEGKIPYRDCEVGYYTYSMFDTPNKYRVNVNVHIQSSSGTRESSLVIDEVFENESDAINFAIETGKKFIDHSYESGKVTILKTITEQPQVKNDKKVAKPANKEASGKK